MTFLRSIFFPEQHYKPQIEPGAFWIAGNPAHGSRAPVPILIGDIRRYGTLTNANFGKICEVINRNTLPHNYPTGLSRHNHNGTHSARQARMVEILFDLFANGPMKKWAELYSEEEKMHLKLSAYLIRSGRVDESSHTNARPDDYYLRSAAIYGTYAKQLNTPIEIIGLFQRLIYSATKPLEITDLRITLHPKWNLAWTCLSVAHDLDLLRCTPKEEFREEVIGRITSNLAPYLDEEISEKTEKSLIQFSKNLILATGNSMRHDEKGADQKLFHECSSHGSKCWTIVKNVPFPPVEKSEELRDKPGDILKSNVNK